MADSTDNQAEAKSGQLEGGAYEVIRSRLDTQAAELRQKLAALNEARKEVFGAVPTSLLATERITTVHNCVPRDMVAIGEKRFLFGYNVHLGLKTETQLKDVFAAYDYDPDEKTFQSAPLDLISDEGFQADFKDLYRYYKNTTFAKFSIIGPHLFMVFRVGRSVADIKTFKWLVGDDSLKYLGNRSDHDFRYPPQHEFEWTRTHRDLHRSGAHPHISIEDRVFVETIGGDLTIKVEDNTDSGAGIYSEPVEHPDQTLDDAEIFYALVGNLILLKIRPYQERDFRYFIYNEKLQEALRIDAIHDACVLLPDDQGIIFSNGYYLQLGESKQFPNELKDMVFERRAPAPNGEDYLYVFYNRELGLYALMSYNIIEQKVESPILCSGFSIFRNGQLAFFKAQEEPQRTHAIQIWQTPYLDHEAAVPEKSDSFLFKIGNRGVVRGMAECRELLTLIGKEDTFSGLYVDIVKRSNAILDSYFWLSRSEAQDLKTPLEAIKQAAGSAIDEFEKVIRLKRHAAESLKKAAEKAEVLLRETRAKQFQRIEEFVEALSGLRRVRGELISLKEIRYMNVGRVDELEKEVSKDTEAISERCVSFLLQPESLDPYHERVEQQTAAIEEVGKVTEAKQLEEDLGETGNQLEMLIEIVSNLRIDDATQTTQIIDGISAIFAPLNQAKAALKRRRQELGRVEGQAQFTSQLRLLDQSAINYLDLADTPDRCDENLTRVMSQLEELESKFADYDEFVVQLTEKRDELYGAFESRKLALVETRNRRAAGLVTAADRIVKGIQNRAKSIDAIDEINGYFASDLMVERVREIIKQLLDLQDTVKASELQGRIKAIKEEAVRQLKDRLDLFAGGSNVIQFGKHRFTVNTQQLELTMLNREGELFYHLTGTNFFESVADPRLEETRSVWPLEFYSETPSVYRAEFLAFRILEALSEGSLPPGLSAAAEAPPEELLVLVQKFMAPRYSEGYVKGIHDHDAALILRPLLEIHLRIGLLRYSPKARACAAVFWEAQKESDPVLAAKLEGFRLRNELFPGCEAQSLHVTELEEAIIGFNEGSRLFSKGLAGEAAHYLFDDLTTTRGLVISGEASRFVDQFESYLRKRRYEEKFQAAWNSVKQDLRSSYQLIREWAAGFVQSAAGAGQEEKKTSASEGILDEGYVDEAAAYYLRKLRGAGSNGAGDVVHASVKADVSGLAGDHAVIVDGAYRFNYNDFMARLQTHEKEVAPMFRKFHQAKAELVEAKREDLRLNEFTPRVLSSFVRNRLIDSVFLPLIGDNLAKQIGVAGEGTRTDRMGLLLLISPPGYGKTTLMEYIANRLGIIFMKVNGPAIGHGVTSLDPGEAKNASAREEIEKVNLALEMGDNVMIYLDDIQHCHPELLQKFISLCDAQRKIEGVYNGRAQTYDLRGRKVAVVMAGNPYTESGQKFRIPDMLANRADTYNLGDIIGNTAEAFKMSYLENALTSNAALNVLGSRSQKDVYAVIKIAETDSREGVSFEAAYSKEEIDEMVGVMKKLIQIRDVILKVNLEYIRSAGQADEYRTEPPFLLQGSYRNMNRLAEKVQPIMNDDEVMGLIIDHYKNESQTLTSGAESNFLKFKELIGILTEAEAKRLDDIRKSFKRNLLLKGADQSDPVGRVIAQLATFSGGLDSIRDAIEQAMAREVSPAAREPEAARPEVDWAAVSSALATNLEGIKEAISQASVEKKGKKPSPAEWPREAVEQLSSFGKGLAAIQASIEAVAKQQKDLATFRVTDSSTPSDYQITSVTQDTLHKIWALVEEDRKARQTGAADKGGGAAKED